MQQLFQLKSSNQYIYLITLLHVIALFAFVFLSIIFIVKVLCILGCVVSFFYVMYKFKSIGLKQIEVTDKSIIIFKSQRSEIKAKVLSGSVVTEFYLCLYCKEIKSGKKNYFILMKDSFKDKVQYRDFSAWLKQAVI